MFQANASQTSAYVRLAWRICSATDLGPTPIILIQSGLGGREFAPLTSSQGLLMLPIGEHSLITALSPRQVGGRSAFRHLGQAVD